MAGGRVPTDQAKGARGRHPCSQASTRKDCRGRARACTSRLRVRAPTNLELDVTRSIASERACNHTLSMNGRSRSCSDVRLPTHRDGPGPLRAWSRSPPAAVCRPASHAPSPWDPARTPSRQGPRGAARRAPKPPRKHPQRPSCLPPGIFSPLDVSCYPRWKQYMQPPMNRKEQSQVNGGALAIHVRSETDATADLLLERLWHTSMGDARSVISIPVQVSRDAFVSLGGIGNTAAEDARPTRPLFRRPARPLRGLRLAERRSNPAATAQSRSIYNPMASRVRQRRGEPLAQDALRFALESPRGASRMTFATPPGKGDSWGKWW